MVNIDFLFFYLLFFPFYFTRILFEAVWKHLLYVHITNNVLCSCKDCKTLLSEDSFL